MANHLPVPFNLDAQYRKAPRNMVLASPILIFAAFTAYSILHSLLASLRVKGWAYKRFGERGERLYRLGYNVIGVITLLPILALLALLPGEELYSWPSPWIYLALLMQFLGALIIIIGLLQTGVWSFFGLGWLFGEEDSSPENLITTGLYSRMRHPLYTGGLLLLWFMPIMTSGLLAFNLAATLYLYIGSIFEERRLQAAFGDQYTRYQRRVPRLIPLPWRWRKQDPTD